MHLNLTPVIQRLAQHIFILLENNYTISQKLHALVKLNALYQDDV